MLKSYKYKVGDNVLLYEDLSTKRYIKARYATSGNDRYVLDNDRIVTEYDITYYSAPIARIALENSTLKNKLSEITKQFDELSKKINEKIFKPEPIGNSYWGNIIRFSSMLYVTPDVEEKPKVLTLEERIEQLEAKKVKKVSKKKNKKSKK